MIGCDDSYDGEINLAPTCPPAKQVSGLIHIFLEQQLIMAAFIYILQRSGKLTSRSYYTELTVHMGSSPISTAAVWGGAVTRETSFKKCIQYPGQPLFLMCRVLFHGIKTE